MRKSAQLIPLVAAVLCAGCGGSASSSGHGGQSARRAEDVIGAQIQQILNQNKQQIFSNIHPVGTAKGATLHDVAITWKHGRPTNRLEDVEAFTVRYTLYWEGPLTKDGVTKVCETFDAESQRWVGFQILHTNGMTNQQAGEAIGQIGGAMLSNYRNDNN